MSILFKKSVFHVVMFVGIFTLLFGYQNCGKVHFDKQQKVSCTTAIYDEVGACCTSEAVVSGVGSCGNACVWVGDKNISASTTNLSHSGDVVFAIPDNSEIERVTFNFGDGSGEFIWESGESLLVSHYFSSSVTQTFQVQVTVKKVGEENCSSSQTIHININVGDVCSINTNLAGDDNGTVYQMLDFEVSMSNCPVSGFVIDWDKESDGSVDSSFQNISTAEFSYSSPGTYTIKARTQFDSTYGIGSVDSTKQVIITCPPGSYDNHKGACVCNSNSLPVPVTGLCPLSSCFIPAHTTQTWSVGGVQCEFEVIEAESVPHNSLREFTDSVAPNTGVASFRCENGNLSNMPEPGATCTKVTSPPSSCVLQIADIELTANSGQTRNVYRRVLSPAACGYSCPYESLSCQSGHFVTSTGVIVTDGSVYYMNEPACSLPCPSSCVISAGTSRTWSVSGLSCTAITTSGSLAHNSSRRFTDSDQPNTGEAFFKCNNGVLSVSPELGATCVNSTPPPPPSANPEIIYSKTLNGSSVTNFISSDKIFGRLTHLGINSLGCTEADVADPSILDSVGACSNSSNYVKIDTYSYSNGTKHWNWDGSTWRTVSHNSNNVFGHELFIPSTFKTCVKKSSSSQAVCSSATVQGPEPKVIISKTEGGPHCNLSEGCTFDFATDSVYTRIEGVAPKVFDFSGKANMRGCTATWKNPTYCDVSSATEAYSSSKYIALPKDDWSCTDGQSCVWSGVRRFSGAGFTHKLSETDPSSMIGQFKVCAYNKFSNKIKCSEFKVTGAPAVVGCPAGQALDGSGVCVSCSGSGQAMQNGRCYSCGTAHNAAVISGSGVTPVQPNADGRTLCSQTSGINPIPQLGAVQGNSLGWGWSCPNTSTPSVSCFRAYGCVEGYALVNGVCERVSVVGQYRWESRDRVYGPGSGCHLGADQSRARQDVSRGILLERGTPSAPDFIVNELNYPCNASSDGQVIQVYQTCGGWQSGLEGYSGYRCERSDKTYDDF